MWESHIFSTTPRADERQSEAFHEVHDTCILLSLARRQTIAQRTVREQNEDGQDQREDDLAQVKTNLGLIEINMQMLKELTGADSNRSMKNTAGTRLRQCRTVGHAATRFVTRT